MFSKKCIKCQEEKEITSNNFRQCKYSSGKLYFKSICRKCESNNTINYNKNNTKSIVQKEKFLKYKKIWRNLNKDRENKKYSDRLANDVTFKLRKNVSRAINHALKSFGGSKKSSIMNYLSYSIEDLKIHLKNQFDDNMNWNNYGNYWHIDHIIPQSCLPYTSMNDNNFKRCWDLSNLRPLEAKENMLDGSTRIRHKIFRGEL